MPMIIPKYFQCKKAPHPTPIGARFAEKPSLARALRAKHLAAGPGGAAAPSHLPLCEIATIRRGFQALARPGRARSAAADELEQVFALLQVGQG